MTPNASKHGKFGSLGGHIVVHIFAFYVGVGVAKRIPVVSAGSLAIWHRERRNRSHRDFSILVRT